KNKKNKIVYFGLDRPEKYLSSKEHATDSTYCRNCSNKLDYKGIYFSHLGHWYCPKCGSKRPKLDNSNWPSPLPGIYNEYNTLAAVSLAQELGLEDENIKNSLNGFQPAFGRQEEIVIDEKRIKIFLSKNPAGFNASLRTVIDLKPKTLLLVLNDRIPDGRDISWIWDVDFEMIPQGVKIIVSGDRVYDLALRIKYTQKSQIPNPKSQINPKLQISEDLKEAINRALSNIEKGETLYILPTYSAMLEVRQILKGRKIL
ncbi:DUF1727 domain-containing protein, partial [Candidatus Gottesmanbacteria bacterium]|nr:DUF1727 domain-containing protein [Candidatus Gottesmanbacteria bacterium]